jgi:hypothetical protein
MGTVQVKRPVDVKLPAVCVSQSFKNRVYDAAKRSEMSFAGYIRWALIEKLERDAAS